MHLHYTCLCQMHLRMRVYPCRIDTGSCPGYQVGAAVLALSCTWVLIVVPYACPTGLSPTPHTSRLTPMHKPETTENLTTSGQMRTATKQQPNYLETQVNTKVKKRLIQVDQSPLLHAPSQQMPNFGQTQIIYALIIL